MATCRAKNRRAAGQFILPADYNSEEKKEIGHIKHRYLYETLPIALYLARPRLYSILELRHLSTTESTISSDLDARAPDLNGRPPSHAAHISPAAFYLKWHSNAAAILSGLLSVEAADLKTSIFRLHESSNSGQTSLSL